jgi:hypothetical protein
LDFLCFDQILPTYYMYFWWCYWITIFI